ncbi:MAG: hypothetical protein KZQ90_17095 [Candidatus Thiodiazotropha sp. (ex Codakia rugifera)]|nr:hypothetical protein [Candidatus Thiodiazotropha sp. (ex Codakia rugifera)]
MSENTLTYAIRKRVGFNATARGIRSAEHAEEISEQASNLKSTANEAAYYLSVLMGMVLEDTGKPADYVMAGCSHTIRILTDLVDSLDAIESEARRSHKDFVSQ